MTLCEAFVLKQKEFPLRCTQSAAESMEMYLRAFKITASVILHKKTQNIC